MLPTIKLIECPRDAMQGIKTPIPAEKKIALLQALLNCGFHTIDAGSFVNPYYIPQLADTAEVFESLKINPNNHTKLLAIVANERGATRAVAFPLVKYLGYPFSISETFQRNNTNSTRLDAFIRLQKIHEIAKVSGKEVVAYISMAFGNPYKEDYSTDLVIEWALKIANLGIKTISLADTVGNANYKDIMYLFKTLTTQLPNVEIGAHFHSEAHTWEQKIIPAFENGCLRFDGALLGVGGCPMSGTDLVGNIATENLINFFQSKGNINIHIPSFQLAMEIASKTYFNLH